MPDNHCCCGCANCIGHLTPRSYQVTFGNFVSHAPCAECEKLNASFSVDSDGVNGFMFSGIIASGCIKSLELLNFFCGAGIKITVVIGGFFGDDQLGNTHRFTGVGVALATNDGLSAAWNASASFPIDCMSLDQDLPLVLQPQAGISANGGQFLCRSTGGPPGGPFAPLWTCHIKGIA